MNQFILPMTLIVCAVNLSLSSQDVIRIPINDGRYAFYLSKETNLFRTPPQSASAFATATTRAIQKNDIEDIKKHMRNAILIDYSAYKKESTRTARTQAVEDDIKVDENSLNNLYTLILGLIAKQS